jgi:glycosyltransferase involved in cell wall biosynthesis
VSLGKRSRWDLAGFLVRLVRAVRRARPDVLHGYLGLANLLALGLRPVAGARVVWGIRSSDMDLARYDWAETLLFRLQCATARFADLLVVNSHAGRDWYLRHGVPAERVAVVANGIDTAHFRPDADLRRRGRAAWGVGAGETLVGLAARLDPMKDHPTFLGAAALLAARRPGVRFVCAGDGPAAYRDELRAGAEELGLGERLLWAGPCGDMPAVTNALDLAGSSSAYGEGFSNAVAEAMACAVPCVVTDVGDSAFLVGDPVYVVPPRNPEALAAAWENVLALPPERRAALGWALRERVVSTFSVARLAADTGAALARILSAGQRPRESFASCTSSSS